MKGRALFVLLAMFRVLASGSDGGDSGRKTDGIADQTKNRLITSPLIYYTPETNLAFGVAGSYLFRDSNARAATPPSVVSPIFIYTLNKQFRVQVTSDIYLNQEGYFLRAEAKLENYPANSSASATIPWRKIGRASPQRTSACRSPC